jgi:hypothetical protein
MKSDGFRKNSSKSCFSEEDSAVPLNRQPWGRTKSDVFRENREKMIKNDAIVSFLMHNEASCLT